MILLGPVHLSRCHTFIHFFRYSMCTCNNETASWPGVIHRHPEIYFPLSSGNLHGPDEGGGVAGDGHSPGHPPSEHEHGVPGDEGGDHPEHQHAHAARPDRHLPPEPAVGDNLPKISLFKKNID